MHCTHRQSKCKDKDNYSNLQPLKTPPPTTGGPPVHRKKTSSALTQNSALAIKCSSLISVGCFELFFIFCIFIIKHLPLAKSSSFLTRLLLFTAKREHEASKSLQESQDVEGIFHPARAYTRVFKLPSEPGESVPRLVSRHQ